MSAAFQRRRDTPPEEFSHFDDDRYRLIQKRVGGIISESLIIVKKILFDDGSRICTARS